MIIIHNTQINNTVSHREKDGVPTVFDIPQHLQVYSVFSQLHLIAPVA